MRRRGERRGTCEGQGKSVIKLSEPGSGCEEEETEEGVEENGSGVSCNT